MLDKEQKPFELEKLIINEFRLVKGQVEAPAEFEIDSIQDYAVENQLDIGLNFDKDLVKTEIIIEVKSRSSEVNPVEAEGKFQFVFIFKYEELKTVINGMKEELFILNPEFAASLAAVTYSTSRGILLTRMQGTPLQNFILPIIDANNLLRRVEV